jgi:CspA family cold shock protein
MNGKVKFFNKSKGFGFVTGEDGKDYFMHQSGIEQGVFVKDNDEVTFELEQGDRGPRATKVSKKATE